MNRPIALVALAVVGTLLLVRARRRPQQPKGIARLRASVESALSDIENRTKDLRKQGKKLSGEARQRLEQQAEELDERRKELRVRLEELRADAAQLVDRARNPKR